MGMCCEKKMMIGWRNACSMKWRVQDKEEDQRGPGERLSKRTVKHVNWTEDAMDRSKWRKLTKDVRWPVWVWVGECFFWYLPTGVVPDQTPLNGCVCMYWQTLEFRCHIHFHCLQTAGLVWVDECFLWYWPTRVVPDKRPSNGCVCSAAHFRFQWRHQQSTDSPVIGIE